VQIWVELFTRRCEWQKLVANSAVDGGARDVIFLAVSNHPSRAITANGYCTRLLQTIIANLERIAKPRWYMPPPSEGTTHAMSEFGKLLVLFGVILVAAGLVLILLGRTNLPIGRLPGDFLYRGKNTTVYFPLVTSLLLSVVLSLVLYLISRFRR
jgi:hypothetical protein